MKVGTGITEQTKIYLQERIKTLSAQERIVNLIADEIYCSQRAEFLNGKFYGLEESRRIKTMLVFHD